LTTLHFNKPTKELIGEIYLPASKSITNRALILNHLSNNAFSIINQSKAQDSILLDSLLKEIIIFSRQQSIREIHTDNAGTVFRFLTTLLSITKGDWILTGSARMKQRPIKGLVNALHQIGGSISYFEKKGFPPLLINGKTLNGGTIEIEANTSSQFITSLLLISAFLKDGLNIIFKGKPISKPYISMTLKILEYFGIESEINGYGININKQVFKPKDILIESDWSAASYWYEMASFSENVDIKLIGLTKNGWQGDAIIAELFNNFGVRTDFLSDGIRLTKTNSIVKEFSFDFTDFPDIAQTVAVSCAGLGIKAELKGLESLTVKECNRLTALETELNKIGCKAFTINNNTLKIEPSDIKTEPVIHVYDDHRMAMSFAPLAILHQKLNLDNKDVVKKSYPDFWIDLQGVGFTID
jgi:3-phosphoshikimate 1-carboxyvinyltransferase